MREDRTGTGSWLTPHLPRLWKGKWLLLAGALISGGIAYGYTKAQPARYEAVSIVVLPGSGGGMSAIANLIPSLGKDASPLSILAGMGNSAVVVGKVAEAMEMKPVDVRESLSFNPDPATNQLEVAAQSTDKDKAMRMVKHALDSLREVAEGTSRNLASEQSTQIENTLKVKEKELAQSEDALLAFQNRLKTAPDPANPLSGGAYLAQLKQVEYELGKVETEFEFARQTAIKRGEPAPIPQVSPAQQQSWKQRLAEVEYQLGVAETKFGPSAPEVELLRRQLTVTREQTQAEIAKYIRSVQENVDFEVATLAGKRQVLEWQREYLAGLAKLAPGEALELQRLIREIQARGEVVKNVRQQYELSRLDSQVYRIQYTMLVPPMLEEEPVNQRASMPTLIAAILGFLIGAGCIIGSNLLGGLKASERNG